MTAADTVMHDAAPTSGDEAPNRETVLRIPASRLYWAVLEAPPLSGWGRRGLHLRRDLDALRYAFEPWLPAPLEEIEARFTPLAPGSATYIACGVERCRLESMLGDCADDGDVAIRNGELGGEHAVQQTPESARPDALPGVVLSRIAASPASGLEPAQVDRVLEMLELRTGEFLGPVRRGLRRRLLIGSVAAAVLASALVTVALFAAARSTRSAAIAARSAAAAIASDAVAAATSSGGGAGPNPELRLAAEVRALERTRELPAGVRSVGPAGPGGPGSLLKADRGPLYIALLARWPESIPVRVESLLIDQEAVTIRGQTRGAADAEALLLAIDGLGDGVDKANWTVQGRSLGASGESAAFTAALARSEHANPPTGGAR